MDEPQPITSIKEIRDAIRAEQGRARRAGSPAMPALVSGMNSASLPQRIMSAVRGLPLLGRAARWAYGLYKAPERIRDLLTLIRLGDDEAKRAQAERKELTASLKRDAADRYRLLGDDIRLLREASNQVETGLAELSRSFQDHQAGAGDLDDRLAAVTGRANDLNSRLATAESHLGNLQAEMAGMEEPLALASAEQKEERRRVEAVAAVYPRLESRFRGPRALIQERQKVYLPFLEEGSPAKSGLPILDLGCGRGEWLELLAGNGFTALGVEQNQVIASECRGMGLKVEDSEAVLFLSGLEEGSVGAVTAFHLLEHLPFAVWLGLLRETARVLAPGGMAIFETPNPANILVSSDDFFLDPTHVRPIPSRLLCHVVETVGLVRCRVLELHPRRDESEETAGGAEPLLERHLLGPQDYGVVAWKD